MHLARVSHALGHIFGVGSGGGAVDRSRPYDSDWVTPLALGRRYLATAITILYIIS